jgi:GT2 family glycosyltransferase/glycosyltransferase involved in cell wall biosynthesis
MKFSVVQLRIPSALRALRSSANRARDAHDWAVAAEQYERYLLARPDDTAIRIQAGHMRKEAGDYAAAERHYLIAKAATPDDADLALQLGHFYQRAGRYLEALASYQRAAILDPQSEDAAREQQHMTGRLNLLSGSQEARATSVPDDWAAAEARLSADAVVATGLFDAGWYLRSYPDVQSDPLSHFMEHGRAEGRRPGPGFEPEWYVETYPEVARMGVEPFAHFVLVGREQGLRPAGPPVYERWVKAFDTLSEVDYREIDAHIRDAQLPPPDVILHVDRAGVATASRCLFSLRAQRLSPRRILICPHPALPVKDRESVIAAAGSDATIRFIDSEQALARIGEGPSAPLILIDAGTILREHSLYLLVLARNEGAAFAYGDDDRIGDDGVRQLPLFKPGPSPLLLHQIDYLGGCVLLPEEAEAGALARALTHGTAGVREIARDAFLGCARSAIHHVPHILSHAPDRSPASPSPLPLPSDVPGNELPCVSIIVPTRNRIDLLRVCIESLLDRTDYPRALLDVIVVDNGSDDPATLEYLDASGDRFRVLRDPSPFNYARLNNLAAAAARGDVLVLLNNDTEIVDRYWLKGLVRYTALPDVGAVGPKLLYDDGTIQHAGVVLGIGVAAAHAHVGIVHDAPGDYGFAQTTREVTAVTGACLAVRKNVFDELGGLDEKLAVAFNDVDFCLSALQAGYRNIYVHDVWLRHFESKSRGVDDTTAKVDIFIGEANYARRKHPALFSADPFYNPNLSLNLRDFYQPAFPPRCAYSWRTHASKRRRPRILLLAAIERTETDVADIIALQADYLAEQGYDVHVGSTRGFPRFESREPIRQAILRSDQAAASYAIAQSIDCVVAETATFAGISRLLGPHHPVLLLHHGFSTEAKASGRAGRDERVAVRLALPVAAGVFASSAATALELEEQSRILPIGGDRVGTWSQAAIPARSATRRRLGWVDKLVILVEGPLSGRPTAPFYDIAEHMNLGTCVLVDQSGILKAPFVRWPSGEQIADVLAAGDMIWTTSGGSALLEAEGSAFGLPIATTAADLSAERAAALIASVAADAGVPALRTRAAAFVPWGTALRHFEEILPLPHGRPSTDRQPALVLKAEPLIERSGLFDPAAYLHFNPDVAVAGIDPLRHFIEHGSAEGRRPTFLFDTKWYLAKYPEVRLGGLSPIAHYLSCPTGRRDPNPYFSNSVYLDTYPDCIESGLTPLIHYVRHGAHEGRSIGPNFDANFYADAYADVRGSGLSPFEHFMRIGDADGRLPVQPILSPLDLFDDAAVEAACGRPIDDVVPQAGPITDRRTAARFCIALLRNDADVRERFPDALSAGTAGAFFRWLENEGGVTHDLGARELHFIASLLDADYAAAIRQRYLVRTDLRRLMPFALLPEGRGGLLRWCLDNGAAETVSMEEVWWLLLTCAENPARELDLTYSFLPPWQQAFPDAGTVFGHDHFCDWLERRFGLAPSRDTTWITNEVPPARAIRIAYNARPAWRARHPDAFSSVDHVRNFLAWLFGPEADVSMSARDWVASLDPEALAAELIEPGVNMFGHFCYPSGLRTSTEALVRGCEEAGLRTSKRDIWVQLPGDDDRHVDFRGPELFDKTILLCQPEPLFDTAYARAGVAPRQDRPYRIGYWYWEQDEIPDIWCEKAKLLDEVWTSTEFVGDALKAKLDVPVRVIPHGIETPTFKRRSRSYFGLPEDQYLFLFTFHMMSVMERKNPIGLIRAFRAEFSPTEKVGLVLKTSFGSHHPAQIEEMRREAAGANITIIDAVLTKGEVLALMDSCDAYVSLHRSEGYGLTMAEAMLIGKPTIATGYSGNLGFMTADNSLLVDYNLAKLDRDYPPYKAGSRWAIASTKHAGVCMRRVQTNPEWGRELGAKAKADLETRFSFAASGRMIRNRLAEIDALMLQRRLNRS